MQKPFIVPLLGLLLSCAAPAQEPETRPSSESRPLAPKDQVAAIDAELHDALNAFYKAYSAAETPEEKGNLFKEKYPRPENWFPRLLAIAKADAKGDGAEAALLWIVTHDRTGKETEAVEILLRDHVASKGLTEAADAFSHSRSPRADEFLRMLEEKSPHREVKGRALYARAEQKQNLARTAEWLREAKEDELAHAKNEFRPEELARLQALDPKTAEREIETLLVRVKNEYADVEAAYGGTLGDRAEGDLFEMRSLAIGKPAPEIQGEDIEGKPLKLSDFKGKVVVLDFWGHW